MGILKTSSLSQAYTYQVYQGPQIGIEAIDLLPSTPTSPGPGGSKSWHRHPGPMMAGKILKKTNGMVKTLSFQVIFSVDICTQNRLVETYFYYF